MGRRFAGRGGERVSDRVSSGVPMSGRISAPAARPRYVRAQRWIARLQAVYYVATGAWPVVRLDSAHPRVVRGEDPGLVATAGVLVTLIGIVLWMAARPRRPFPPEFVFLAAGTAAGLVAIDLWRVASVRIAAAQVVDAVVEFTLIALWTAVGMRRVRARGSRSYVRLPEHQEARWN
jgi:hypothetical protein